MKILNLFNNLIHFLKLYIILLMLQKHLKIILFQQKVNNITKYKLLILNLYGNY